MTKVGYFLFYWSLFELALAKAVEEVRERLGDTSAVGKLNFRERVTHWADLATKLPENAGKAHIAQGIRDQASALRDIRNQIVHGLIGGDAQPMDNGPAYICCAIGGFEEPTDKVTTYGLADLEDFIQGIDACRRGLIGLDNFNYRIQQ